MKYILIFMLVIMVANAANLTIPSDEFTPILEVPYIKYPMSQNWTDELQRNLTVHISDEYEGNITVYYGNAMVFYRGS